VELRVTEVREKKELGTQLEFLTMEDDLEVVDYGEGKEQSPRYIFHMIQELVELWKFSKGLNVTSSIEAIMKEVTLDLATDSKRVVKISLEKMTQVQARIIR
jgi:hypothetical protein